MVPRNNVCSCSLDTENVIDTDDFTRDKNVNEFLQIYPRKKIPEKYLALHYCINLERYVFTLN